ncbi:mammalian cell entry protein [Mycobacterium sp. 852014-50255_SCH5639931]|uniref:mammalian cell entry protein n=1 Tax=Mycobacterium sp. 852014-50255_SCH5639931 TaxID=1834112 RepID=UPI0007FD1691|nr:mammalian cell entry protein [Mycobacterium sp. 852014-50255_SCH5639931]OBB65019.1 mammalian cell entry protein [Mycobacterium sp. 852014-50255_SCH5639931]
MEDQQPAAGDLTAHGSAAAEEPAPEERAETADADEDSSAAAESTTESGDAEPAEAQAGGRKRRKWLAGKRLAITVVVAALLFVGSAAFAGAVVQPYLSDRAAAATKLKVARTAADAITTLWTYTPENMDTLADRASRYLSGDFEAQYRKFVDAIVAPNKQAKITNHTDVTGAAVETIDDANAVVIVYTNTTSTSPLTKNVPSLKYLSYRLFLKRAKSRWLVTRMTTITSLDLTPHV